MGRWVMDGKGKLLNLSCAREMELQGSQIAVWFDSPGSNSGSLDYDSESEADEAMDELCDLLRARILHDA